MDGITQVEPVDTPKSKRNSPSIVLVVGFLLLLIVSVFLYLLFFTQILDDLNLIEKKESQEQQQEEVVPDESEDETEEEFTTYKGKTISAQLPTNWSIQEYYDGDGTDMLTDGVSFTGLTGLKIFKDKKELFYVQAVYGIGFAGCPSYAKFADENKTYYNQLIDDNKVTGTELNILDYTNSEYSEFEWLGKTFRRVGKEYNYDTVPNNVYFESACVPTLVSFDGLQFQPEDGPAALAYDYSLTDIATLDDLEVIDSILESMVLVN